MTTTFNENPTFLRMTEIAAQIAAAETNGVNWDELPGEARESWLQETRKELTPMFALFASATAMTVNETVRLTMSSKKRVKAEVLAANLQVSLDSLFKVDVLATGDDTGDEIQG